MLLYLLQATAIVCFVQHSYGDRTCYCNRPECSNSNTCISQSNKCYSKIYPVLKRNNSALSTDEHGCLDLLVDREMFPCTGNGDAVKKLMDDESLIMCCSDELCNFRKNQDMQVDIVNSQSNPNGEGVYKDSENIVYEDSQGRSDDILFRASVIAVPIAGGVILVVLILMAVRMLRDDRRSPTSQSFTKAQGFIHKHFIKTNTKYHKKLHPITDSDNTLAKLLQYDIKIQVKPLSGEDVSARTIPPGPDGGKNKDCPSDSSQGKNNICIV